MSLKSGDKIVAINGKPVAPDEIAHVISGSNGRPLTVAVERDGQRVQLGPTKPKKTDGAYRLGFVLAGQGLDRSTRRGRRYE